MKNVIKRIVGVILILVFFIIIGYILYLKTDKDILEIVKVTLLSIGITSVLVAGLFLIFWDVEN